MGSKGHRLWVMGQLDSNVQSPTPKRTNPNPLPRPVAGSVTTRGVALQVAFERRTWKPVFHLIGYRLWV
jgi:hypothetical protein